MGGERIEELAEALAVATIELGAVSLPRRREERLSYERVVSMRDTLVEQSPTLRALAEVSSMASLRVASLVALDALEPGQGWEPQRDREPVPMGTPARARWQARLRRELGAQLRQERFGEDEIRWILSDGRPDGLMGWWGILDSLWRLHKVMRAYERARATVGAPPP